VKVFLVVGAAPSWHASGWGAAVRAADADRVLVSFVEYVKSQRQEMAISVPPGPYQPIINRDARAVEELAGLLNVKASHRELLREEDDENLSGRA
jgi:hypothetical protein